MDSRRVLSIVIVAAIAILGLAGPIKIAREQLASGDAEAAAADDGAAAGGSTVSMAGLKFAPATLTVAKGTEVQFINDDTAPHTVTADDSSIDSGTLGPGTSFPFVVQKPFSYHCAIHPSMTAEIRLNG
jgi:plastocyanin